MSARSPADPPPEVAGGVLQKVQAFAGSAPQSDDIAILAVKVARS